MFNSQILTYLLQNKEATADVIASNLGFDKSAVISALHNFKERELTQYSSYDFSWSLTDSGRFYARNQNPKAKISKYPKTSLQKSNPCQFGIGDEVKIEIGDLVKIKFEDGDSFSFIIVYGKSSWDDDYYYGSRFINHKALLAEAIMQKKIKLGSDSGLSVNGRSFRVVELHRKNQEA